MSNRFKLLTNAAAGATGESLQLADDNVYLKVTATDWGGQSVQLEELVDGAWSSIPSAVFTADDAKVYQGATGQIIRPVTTGSGGTMAGVNVEARQRFA